MKITERAGKNPPFGFIRLRPAGSIMRGFALLFLKLLLMFAAQVLKISNIRRNK